MNEPLAANFRMSLSSLLSLPTTAELVRNQLVWVEPNSELFSQGGSFVDRSKISFYPIHVELVLSRDEI